MALTHMEEALIQFSYKEKKNTPIERKRWIGLRQKKKKVMSCIFDILLKPKRDFVIHRWEESK